MMATNTIEKFTAHRTAPTRACWCARDTLAGVSGERVDRCRQTAHSPTSDERHHPGGDERAQADEEDRDALVLQPLLGTVPRDRQHRHSTSRKPDGRLLGSAYGRSTTNSVRRAGNTCSLISTGFPVGVGGDALAAQHRTRRRHTQQRSIALVDRVGADGLGGTAQRDAEQFVERVLLDVATAQVLAQIGRAPHGDHGERLAVGEVESLHPQHLIGPEHLGDAMRRAPEREFEDASLGPHAPCFELSLDGAQFVEVLTHRLAGDVPPEPLACVDQSLVTQDLERPADGDPTHAELGRQVALAGQHLSHPHDAHSAAQVVGDLLVPDRPHV